MADMAAQMQAFLAQQNEFYRAQTEAGTNDRSDVTEGSGISRYDRD